MAMRQRQQEDPGAAVRGDNAAENHILATRTKLVGQRDDRRVGLPREQLVQQARRIPTILDRGAVGPSDAPNARILNPQLAQPTAPHVGSMSFREQLVQSVRRRFNQKRRSGFPRQNQLRGAVQRSVARQGSHVIRAARKPRADHKRAPRRPRHRNRGGRKHDDQTRRGGAEPSGAGRGRIAVELFKDGGADHLASFEPGAAQESSLPFHGPRSTAIV